MLPWECSMESLLHSSFLSAAVSFLSTISAMLPARYSYKFYLAAKDQKVSYDKRSTWLKALICYVLSHLCFTTSVIGAKYISSRGLLVAAAEVDDRDIGARGVISIYDIATSEKPVYPYIIAPGIGWGASSGLSFGSNTKTLYTIEDSFYGKSRIFRMNAEGHPLVIEEAIRIMDTEGVLEAAAPGFFVNADKTVNLDPEGVTLDSKGMLWVASEGNGSAGDGSAPNVLVQVNMMGVIQKAGTSL
jgi:uncharacterized protein YjiK